MIAHARFAVECLFGIAFLFTTLRAVRTQKEKTMSNLTDELAAAKVQADRLQLAVADRDTQIASLTSQLATANDATNTIAAKLSALQTAGDPAALAAATDLVTELQGIAAPVPVMAVDPAPVAAPTAAT